MIGESDIPALEVTAEAELSRTGWVLAFPAALETRYESDTTAERARELRAIIRLGALGYLVGSGTTKIVMASPLPWWISVMELGGVTAARLTISQRFFRATTPGPTREAALLVCCLIGALTIIVMSIFGDPARTSEYFTTAILPMNFVLVFVPLRFPAAVAFLAVVASAFVTTILAEDPLGGRGVLLPIGMMGGLSFTALIGVHARERAARRLYLHGLLQRLRNERLARENNVLADLTLTDPLTRVANRRRLDAELTAFCESPVAAGALLLIDVDRFKDFNDRFGHLAGDECLRQIAARLAMHLRLGDLLARFGGEEFAVLLPGATPVEAAQTAERLREAVQAQPVHIDGQGVSVTVSLGLAMFDRRLEPEGLLSAADIALYAAKNAGRNLVRAAADGVA
jgi:diguanylate cyclase (GGDEF)-like protein